MLFNTYNHYDKILREKEIEFAFKTPILITINRNQFLTRINILFL